MLSFDDSPLVSLTTLFQRNTQCFNCALFFHEAIFLVFHRRRSVRRFVCSSTASAFSMAWNRPHRRNSTKRGEWAVCRRDDDEASDICNYKWRDAMHEWLPIFFHVAAAAVSMMCPKVYVALNWWLSEFDFSCSCSMLLHERDNWWWWRLVGEISQQRRKSSSLLVETTLLMCFGCALRMGAKS